MMKEDEHSDEEQLAVLLGRMFKHMYSFIEKRGLGSEFAKWMIHNRNEALIDLIRLGSVGDRLTKEAEDRVDILDKNVDSDISRA